EKAQVWGLAGRYLAPRHLDELRGAIAHWRQDHPDQRSFALVRLTDFPEARQVQSDPSRAPGSIFSLVFLDPFANLSPPLPELKQLGVVVDSARDEAIKQASTVIAQQRDEAIKQASSAITQQRDASLRQASDLITAQRTALVSDVESAGDRMSDRFVRHLTVG